MSKLETYDCLYYHDSGHFLLILGTCNCILPPTIECHIPKKGAITLKYAGNPTDIFTQIYNHNKKIGNEPVQKILAKFFGITQQHVSRLLNGYNEFPNKPEMIKKLVEIIKETECNES